MTRREEGVPAQNSCFLEIPITGKEIGGGTTTNMAEELTTPPAAFDTETT